MVVNVYSLLDTKVGLFGVPFCQLHDEQAIRSVRGLCQDMQTVVAQYPDDYKLMKIAVFDDNTGVFVNPALQEDLGVVSSFLSLRARPSFSPVEVR